MQTSNDNLKEYKELCKKAKLIELKPVNSSNIAGIGYDEKNNLLKVAFKNKETYSLYLYQNVEPELYSMLSTTESVGKALSECVIKQKDKYKYLKL